MREGRRAVHSAVQRLNIFLRFDTSAIAESIEEQRYFFIPEYPFNRFRPVYKDQIAVIASSHLT